MTVEECRRGDALDLLVSELIAAQQALPGAAFDSLLADLRSTVDARRFLELRHRTTGALPTELILDDDTVPLPDVEVTE